MTFAARRRRVHPIVIGLMPPSFLCKATRIAPRKKGQIERGAFSLSTIVMKDAKTDKRVPEWPAGKERIAWAISSSETDMGLGRLSGQVSGCGGGAFIEELCRWNRSYQPICCLSMPGKLLP